MLCFADKECAIKVMLAPSQRVRLILQSPGYQAEHWLEEHQFVAWQTQARALLPDPVVRGWDCEGRELVDDRPYPIHTSTGEHGAWLHAEGHELVNLPQGLLLDLAHARLPRPLAPATEQATLAYSLRRARTPGAR